MVMKISQKPNQFQYSCCCSSPTMGPLEWSSCSTIFLADASSSSSTEIDFPFCCWPLSTFLKLLIHWIVDPQNLLVCLYYSSRIIVCSKGTIVYVRMCPSMLYTLNFLEKIWTFLTEFLSCHRRKKVGIGR